MSTFSKCPNCNKPLTGLLSSSLVSQAHTDLINSQLGKNAEAYCTNCAHGLLNKVSERLVGQKAEIESKLKQKIHSIPLMTSPAPIKWDYEVLGMVTAQTTAGTGFITELSRTFNDFFGSGSNATNQKVANATNLCKADLRIQTVRAGGNAIICTDIDFNEIGAGSTNMLMVCMAGTAIRVENLDILGQDKKAAIEEIMDLTNQLDAVIKVFLASSTIN